MGGLLVYAISIGSTPVALTANLDTLEPENRHHVDSLIRHIVAQREDAIQLSGELTIREGNRDEYEIFEQAITNDSIDEKWARLREQAATTEVRDWKGLEAIDWVLLEWCAPN